jgi:hypothetical protein
MLNPIKRQGQVLSEYAVVLGLVVSALIVSQLYIQRALHGRYRDATDSFVGQIAAAGASGGSTQYEPYYQDNSYTSTNDSSESVTYTDGARTANHTRTSSRTGTSTEAPF